MRVPKQLCCVGVSLFFSTSSSVVESLPFRTRGAGGGSDKDDDKGGRNGSDAKGSKSKGDNSGRLKTRSYSMEAVVIDEGIPVNVDIADLVRVVDASGTKPSRRDAIVDAFFQQPQVDEGGGDGVGVNGTAAAVDFYNDQSYELKDHLHKQAKDLNDFLVSTRRTLHQCPELMFNEEETSHIVRTVLDQLDISYTTGWGVNTHQDRIPGEGGYGIVADIGTGKEPCVVLRADMDALPIIERTKGVDDYRSRNEGRMHACGHDGHTTMLLGAASVLKQMEDSIPGTVRLMFQPAEEGGAGGKRMVEEGILQREPKPSHAFGMHVWPTLPSGVVATRPGALMAACERFEIVLSGVGGHAAMPHLTIDPIVTASSVVMNLQTIVSRTISPLESGVCSITKIDSHSDAYNIIPPTTTLLGTIRALSKDTLLELRDRVHTIVHDTAKMHGCNVTVTYSTDLYPPTVNDPDLYDEFSKHVGSLLSRDGRVHETEPTMGAEDFSFVAEAVPSTFFFLGQGSGTHPPTDYGLHHPHFALDESVLPRGVELHVNLALRGIRKLLQQPEPKQQGANDYDAVASEEQEEIAVMAS